MPFDGERVEQPESVFASAHRSASVISPCVSITPRVALRTVRGLDGERIHGHASEDDTDRVDLGQDGRASAHARFGEEAGEAEGDVDFEGAWGAADYALRAIGRTAYVPATTRGVRSKRHCAAIR